MTKLALVTGASSGIGKEIARELYRRQYSLLLVSRREDKLEQVKTELLDALGCDDRQKILLHCADLSTETGIDSVFKFTKAHQLAIDVLVNNAGVALYGPAEKNNSTALQRMLTLNTFAISAFCQHYGALMKERAAGYILNIASLAAYQPVPYIAAYAASKSYVLHYSEALAMEFAGSGVSVSCYSPGHTDTAFYHEAKIPDDHRFYHPSTRVLAAPVAKAAVHALFAKKLSKVHGVKNKVLSALNKFAPRRVTARISRALVKVQTDE